MARVDVSAAFNREAKRIGNIAKGTSKAIQRAASTLARDLPVAARRDIQDEYNLPAGRVRSGLSSRRGGGYVELRASARGIGLINFGGGWRGRKSPGAYAKVFRDESRHNYGGTFIAAGKGGNRQIFSRSIPARLAKARLPIRTLYGPSFASMLRKPDRRSRLFLKTREILASEIQRLTGRS